MSRLSEINSKRAEFAAELFLDGLRPKTLAKSDGPRLPFDFVVTLENPDRRLGMFSVEVKGTTEPVGKQFNFLTSLTQKDYFTKSATPVIILVVDVKRNKMYYGFSSRLKVVHQARKANLCEISVPVSELNDSREFAAALWREPMA